MKKTKIPGRDEKKTSPRVEETKVVFWKHNEMKLIMVMFISLYRDGCVENYSRIDPK